MKFPQVIEYTENGTKFRAEYDKEYDDGKCFYLVYHWYENESVGPFKEPQDLGCWLVYCHQTFEGIMEILNKEKAKMKQLKPFNLEQALAGAPVVTRKGCTIVEIKYMRYTDNLAVVRDEDGHYVSYFIPASGKLSNTIDYATDLFMAPTKKEGWINVYNVHSLDVTGKNIYPTEEAALANKGFDCIATIKIEWEE